MLHGQRLFTQWAEAQVTHAQRSAVESLLRARASVIVDDTNLRAKIVREWAEMAARFGASFEVHDFTDVPLEECLRRDADRPADDQVGADGIRRMHERYLAGRNTPLPVPFVDPGGPGVVYEADPALPPVILVDIDGTVALMAGRSPHEWSRVGEDEPNPAVIAAVRAMHAAGNAIVFCSGRDAECREETEAWLELFVGVPYEALFMRPAGDSRKDSIVKRELFDQHVAERWAVRGVVDDRNQVVQMWRAMGLMCAQVAPGDF
jgi:hypothetical protein